MHVGAYPCLQNGIFLAGQLGSEFFSLPYSLLLDYSVLSSLPYPTLPEIEKPLPFRPCSSGKGEMCKDLEIHIEIPQHLQYRNETSN